MVRINHVVSYLTICEKQLKGWDLVYDYWTKSRTATCVTRRF
ncbi:hypothetical protein SAMN05428981_107149 [Bacillus sp. OV194]|nr:hypothetical protein SAMN05428981_107149 [Bacillus sp. OV194]